MKIPVLILCALGFIFLIVGSVLVLASVKETNSHITIPSSGTIASPEKSQSHQADHQIQLDQIGYLSIFASFGFLIVAILYNRKSTV